MLILSNIIERIKAQDSIHENVRSEIVWEAKEGGELPVCARRGGVGACGGGRVGGKAWGFEIKDGCGVTNMYQKNQNQTWNTNTDQCFCLSQSVEGRAA